MLEVYRRIPEVYRCISAIGTGWPTEWRDARYVEACDAGEAAELHACYVIGVRRDLRPGDDICVAVRRHSGDVRYFRLAIVCIRSLTFQRTEVPYAHDCATC